MKHCRSLIEKLKKLGATEPEEFCWIESENGEVDENDY